jgi:hypothetical protein
MRLRNLAQLPQLLELRLLLLAEGSHMLTLFLLPLAQSLQVLTLFFLPLLQRLKIARNSLVTRINALHTFFMRLHSVFNDDLDTVKPVTARFGYSSQSLRSFPERDRLSVEAAEPFPKLGLVKLSHVLLVCRERGICNLPRLLHQLNVQTQ